MQELADSELVLLARAGDKTAFGELAVRHVETARRLVLRMAGDEELARELIQEALLEAYLSLERLREAEKFKSWLCGIALNLCRSVLRERKRKGMRRTELLEWEAFDLLQLHRRPPDPEETAIERELFERVLSAVQELPPLQREAALLYYFEFLSLDEIAALTGISAGAVKVRLHRAREELRARLLAAYPEIESTASGELRARRVTVVEGQTAREPDRKRREETMIRVRIADIIKRDEKMVVFLLDEAGGRMLPIWIGGFEAASIALGVRGIKAPRPLTFSFIANLLETLGAKLEEARVEALREETFYGVARLRIGDQVKELDARPSDILALAVQIGSPIFVAEEVMGRAGKAVREGLELRPDLDLQAEPELPPLTGEGIDALVRESEAALRWPPASMPAKTED